MPHSFYNKNVLTFFSKQIHIIIGRKTILEGTVYSLGLFFSFGKSLKIDQSCQCFYNSPKSNHFNKTCTLIRSK